MVTKREFNRIKRENPESRIWQRTWEEQKIRDKLYQAIVESKKKWETHPYVEVFEKQLELNEETTKKWERIKKLQWKLADAEEQLKGKDEELLKNSEVMKEFNRKKNDPTRNLRRLSKTVTEKMGELPIEQINKMVNDEKLKRWCVILLNLTYVVSSSHRYWRRNEIIDDEMKKAISNWVTWNDVVQERIGGFIDRVMTEKISSWEPLLWSAYNDLLYPLFDLVWKQENDAVRKYLAKYIAKSWLFPYVWANLDIFRDVVYKDEWGHRIIYSWVRDGYWWLWNVAPSYRKDRGNYDPNRDLTKFLDLFHVPYRFDMEDWDVKIVLEPSEAIPHSNFEVVTEDVRNITQWKLEELKNSDLVLIYRDNSTYSKMKEELESLVKYKYWWRVYCIMFPEWYDWWSVDEQSKDILGKIVDGCPCLTDNTIAQWIWKDTKKIDDVLPISENWLTETQMSFLKMAHNIELSCVQKWIDTIYFISDGEVRDGYSISLLEHGWLCQKKDGTIYYVKCSGGSDLWTIKKYSEDSKRFWKNLFPNVNVKFVSVTWEYGEPTASFNYEKWDDTTWSRN